MRSLSQLLLEIETAKIRHEWAKAQTKSGETTPALEKYLEESLNEWQALEAALNSFDGREES
jgi:hypothetical protein